MKLTDADRAAWARYEAEGKAAARQYRDIPVSFNHAGITAKCACGKKTTNPGGTCRDCRRGAA